MKIRRALAWSFSQNFISLIIQFIGSVVVARLLRPDEVGIFAIAVTALVLLVSVRQLGTVQYLIREKELTNDKIRSAFGVILFINLALFIIIIACRHWIADFYNESGIADVLLLISFNFLITPFGQPAQALLTREMRFDILHHQALASTILGTGTTVILAYNGHSYMSMAWGSLVSSVVSASIMLYLKPDHIKLMPGLKHWKEVTHFGGYLTGAGLVGTFSSDGTKLILGAIISPASVAIYERSIQFPSLIRSSIFGPIGSVLLPALSKDIRDNKPIATTIRRLISTNTVIVWPIFLSIGLIAQPFIVFLFGENWRYAGEILPYVLLAQAILAFLPQPDDVLVPNGRVKQLFQIRLFTMVLHLGVSLVATQFGLKVFAAAQIPISILFLFISWYFMKKLVGFHIATMGIEYGKAGLTALVASVPAFIYFLSGASIISMPDLLAVIVASALLWISCLKLCRHFLYYEMISILANSSTK